MKKIFMYAHGGSGNHGCEAIVKSTINIINDDMYLISEKPEEDIKYGTINSSRLIIEKNEINKKSLDFIKAYFDLKIRNKFVSMDKLNYKEAFSNFKHGDIALSIGGDNYCYANVSKYMMLHDILKEEISLLCYGDVQWNLNYWKIRKFVKI